tara:strand:+ start:2998 stop:3135 length:138 start_codon:yes stop_codon:yes gene_type:complete
MAGAVNPAPFLWGQFFTGPFLLALFYGAPPKIWRGKTGMVFAAPP